MKETIKINGMTCAACASRIEKVVGRIDGVQEINVNFATERLSVDIDPAKTNMEAVGAAVRKAGYDYETIKKTAVDEDKIKKEKEAKRKVRCGGESKPSGFAHRLSHRLTPAGTPTGVPTP